ncbi:hypothetical protein LRX75_15590 [Rhizobium sp. DKSPLA3]|uniref:Uncharacterized protein n=1 Tax=Rhizobium quercicola TaxID=2901226 RepID=A0A9X1T875_9HYPH|nr:hypothetical protein [Rhizobium quercicola]MCD7110458.1 hypothetical protein [Rhizobium quercicola]
MGYYRQIMLDFKNEFGAEMKRRGLRMRGVKVGGDTLDFTLLASDGMGLPISITVDGPKRSGRASATWHEVTYSFTTMPVHQVGTNGWRFWGFDDETIFERGSRERTAKGILRQIKRLPLCPKESNLPKIAEGEFFAISYESVCMTTRDLPGVEIIAARDEVTMEESYSFTDADDNRFELLFSDEDPWPAYLTVNEELVATIEYEDYSGVWDAILDHRRPQGGLRHL